MKFRVVVADPCWNFSDHLTMSDVKRGAKSNYPVLTTKEIKKLPVKRLAAKDAILALWCPSSLIPDGLDTMKSWGFVFKQTLIWVKTKKDPLSKVTREHHFTGEGDLNDVLAFGMGRTFRQTHEVCLIGTRGRIYDKLKNKSKRSVFFHSATKHSQKPENLQDMLDEMFGGQKLELFARRDRKGYVCCGLECPSTISEDIRDSIDRLAASKVSRIITPKQWQKHKR